MREITHSQLVAKLKKMQGSLTVRAFAKSRGVSAPYLYDIYAEKRSAGPKLLEPLGLVRRKTHTVTYYRKGK